MRDFGIFIALATSVAALIISLARRNGAAAQIQPPSELTEVEQHDDPVWFT